MDSKKEMYELKKFNKELINKLCSGIFLTCQLLECQLKLYIQYISFRVWYGLKDNLLERIFWLKQGQK